MFQFAAHDAEVITCVISADRWGSWITQIVMMLRYLPYFVWWTVLVLTMWTGELVLAMLGIWLTLWWYILVAIQHLTRHNRTIYADPYCLHLFHIGFPQAEAFLLWSLPGCALAYCVFWGRRPHVGAALFLLGLWGFLTWALANYNFGSTSDVLVSSLLGASTCFIFMGVMRTCIGPALQAAIGRNWLVRKFGYTNKLMVAVNGGDNE